MNAYIALMLGKGYTVLGLQACVELVQTKDKGFDPYQWVVVEGKYPCYVTGMDKGHYFSIVAMGRGKVVELMVSSKKDMERMNYRILGE